MFMQYLYEKIKKIKTDGDCNFKTYIKNPNYNSVNLENAEQTEYST